MASKALPKQLIFIAKWATAFGLLYLIYRSGKLNLNDFKNFLSMPWAVAGVLGLIAFNACLSFFRWQTLSNAIGLKASYPLAFRLGMLGQFFSTVIPGTVGGDLVKAFYLARGYPDQKLKALSTIVIDRLLGLTALLSLGGFFSFLALPYFRLHQGDAAFQLIRGFAFALLAGAIVVVASVLLFPWLVQYLPAECPIKISLVQNVYRAILAYQKKPKVIVWLWVLSLFLHVINLGVFVVICTSLYGLPPWGSLTLSTFLVATVLGICAVSIPLLPMGLGVGQVAFAFIFKNLGAPDDHFGVTLISGQQLCAILFNLLGVFAYLTYRHDRAFQEALQEK